MFHLRPNIAGHASGTKNQRKERPGFSSVEAADVAMLAVQAPIRQSKSITLLWQVHSEPAPEREACTYSQAL